MLALTADLFAHAIIAAARSFGDDPVLACTSRSGQRRRPLTAAANGISLVDVSRRDDAVRILGLSATTLPSAVSFNRPDFVAASMAARGAVKAWAVLCAPEPEPPAPEPDPEPLPPLDELLTDEEIGDAAREFMEREPDPEPDETPTPAPRMGESLRKHLAEPEPPAPHREVISVQDTGVTVLVPARPPAPEPEPEPEPPRKRHVETAGAISSLMRPGGPIMAEKPPPGGALGDRILRQLRDAPCTSSSLAILCDAKEMEVIGCLRDLESRGIVVPGPIPVQGPRYRPWQLPEASAA
jgi:hypothetical protein